MHKQLCGCGCGFRPLVGNFLPGHNVIARYALVDKAAVFWSRVTRGGPDECWLWSGATANHGYGTMRWKGRLVGTHRISWELAHGPIPAGKDIRHACDVTSCVNPAHLELGTHADNMRDAAIRHRMPLDTNNHTSLDLTWEGETHSLVVWAQRLGISSHALYHRHQNGWTIARMLTTPVRPYRRKHKRLAV